MASFEAKWVYSFWKNTVACTVLLVRAVGRSENSGEQVQAWTSSNPKPLKGERFAKI